MMTDPTMENPAHLLADLDFVRRLARSLCGDEHLAEDVAQQTMVRALEGAPLRGNFRGWLATVARRLVYKEHRGATRRAARERAAEPRPEAPSPAEVLEREQVRSEVVRAVIALPDEHREIILWRYYRGASVRECAERFGITDSAVRSRTARAVARLRARLDERHGGDRQRWAAFIAPLAASSQHRQVGAPQGRKAVRAAAVAATVVTAAWIASTAGRAPIAPPASQPTPSQPRQPGGQLAATDPVRQEAIAPPDAMERTAQDPEPQLLAGSAPMNSDVVGNDLGERWLSCRVVDDLTGQPIPGAEVLLLAETDPQVATEQPPAMSFFADNDGLVMARVDDKAPGFVAWTWVCVRAEGYGHQMDFRSLNGGIVRLPPDVGLPVEVRDWRDQPVADALVSFCGGNGFTPDLEFGRTDRSGRVAFTGVDVHSELAHFYLVHPDLHYGYLSPDYYPGGGPLVLRADPAVAHRGVVVDEAGRPVVGAAVGVSKCHRGPWARTGRDGSFRLCGLRQPEGLWVRVDGRRVLFPEAGVDGLRLQLPPRSGDDADGVQVVQLSPERREQRDAAQRRRDEEQAASRRAWPRVLVRAIDLPATASLKLRTRRATFDIREQVALGEPVALPDEEYVFWIEAEGCVRVVAGDRRASVAAGVVDLKWYAPTQVAGRVLGDDGAALRAQVAFVKPHDAPPGADEPEEWHAVHGSFLMPTALVGAHWMYVRDAGSKAVRIVAVHLPQRGDDVLFDVGDVVVSSTPAHRFERYDGTPLIEGAVELQRAGWTNKSVCEFEPDDDGEIWLPDLLPGDALVVRSELPTAADLEGLEVCELPSRFVVGDQAPAVFRMHAGEVVVDLDGDGSEFACATFGDQLVNLSESGRTVVRGLPPKTYRVLLGAPCRRGVAVPFVVSAPSAAAGRRVLRVTLP